MTSKNPKFDKLFNVTNEHLKEKKYLYKPKMYDTYKKDIEIKVGGFVLNKFVKKIYKNNCPTYTNAIKSQGFDTKEEANGETTYLLKKGDAVIDKKGDIIYKKITPTPHKNVLLSIAFSMAIENYKAIRPSAKGKKKQASDYRLELADMSDMLIRYFSNKYYKTIDDIKPKKNNEIQENTLINIEQDYEYANIEQFRQIEYKLYAVVNTLRNYHSHFVHEPSILSFEDYFEVETKLNTADLEEAKNWFNQRFEDAKKHLLSSLKTRLNFLQSNEETNLDKSDNKIKELEKVITNFRFLFFFNKDKKLSLNGQLFIACMFLYKRQAKNILEKWRNVKNPQGYQNSLQTFFTYFSLNESYSLANFSDPMLKFRDITSKLSTIPSSTNPQMQFIYEKIKALNKNTYSDIEMNDKLMVLINKKEKLKKYNKDYLWVDRKIDKLKDNGFGISKSAIEELKKELKEKNDSLSAFESNITKFKGNEDSLSKNDRKMYNGSKKEISKVTKEIARLKEKIEILENYSLTDEIIPIRKRHILTPILLQYLLDNGLFGKKMKIAVKKTPRNRFEYFEKETYIDNKASILKILNTLDKESEEYKSLKTKFETGTYLDTLIKIKDRIKELKKDSTNDNEEYKALKRNYKYLNTNFTYKTANELIELQKPKEIIIDEDTQKERKRTEIEGFRFTVKKNNAQILYTYNDFEIPITLSPDLLLKWVFIHLQTKKNSGLNLIETHIEKHIDRLLKNDTNAENVVKNFIYNRYIELDKTLSLKELVKKYNALDQANYPNTMNLNNVFPKSIMDALGLRPNKISSEKKVLAKIDLKIKELEDFEARNTAYDKSFNQESKEKIDAILEYIHFRLLYDVYQNEINKKNKKESVKNFIRHNYFNVLTYDIAREYFRFYGRYENNTIYEVEGYNEGDFVKPQQIETLKNNYALCFSYIEQEIKDSLSLEKLFTNVLKSYINNLKKLRTNLGTIKKANKILKIDEEKDIDYINKNLKVNFLDHFALGHNVISVKNQMMNEWQEFENKRVVKLKKYAHFSDFSFIRKTLEETDKGELKTNIDYIFQVILPKTEEVKSNNNKVKPAVFRQLLKMKTEELILWNIAKHYRGNFDINEVHTNDTKKETYQSYTTFNKAYKMDIDYKIVIDKGFWANENRYPYNKKRFKKVLERNPKIIENAEKGINIEVTIKVPAKRYDNKFLKVETELIKEYLLWNHCKDNKIEIPETYTYVMENAHLKDGKKQTRDYKIREFDELMKVIYRDLRMSLNYIGEILRAEKKLLQITSNKLDIEELLKMKYINKEKPKVIKDFYLNFKDADKAVYNAFIDYYNNDTDIDDSDVKEYLQFFRNNALHYQLQDPERKKEILKLLDTINGELNNAKKSEYTTEEY